jgi:hypothetical protein
MALPLVPLIPLILRYGPRAILAAKASWLGWRLYQNKGDIPKTFGAIRKDVVHSYQFFTDTQYRALQKASSLLRTKGDEYTALADALLMLAEIITGAKLTSARNAIKQTSTVANAFSKLSPAAKAVVKLDTAVDITQTLNNALGVYLYAEGLRLINNEGQPKVTPAEYLRSQYLGLYYIGRSGNHLTAEEVDTLASHLIDLHRHIDSERYANIIAWYTTVGVSKPENTLPGLLATCTEVLALDVDTRYIAYALNQPITDLTFDKMSEELSRRLTLVP